jgi:hypothetical protein
MPRTANIQHGISDVIRFFARSAGKWRRAITTLAKESISAIATAYAKPALAMMGCSDLVICDAAK